MYNNTENALTPQDAAPLDNTPLSNSMPEHDGESSAKCSEDSDPCHSLAKLQEHFQQLQEHLTHLETSTYPLMPTEDLAQLTKKLHQLTVTLQPHPPSRPVE